MFFVDFITGMDFKGPWTGQGKSQMEDNQYKLVFTLFAIGYAGVSGAKWLSSLEKGPALI